MHLLTTALTLLLATTSSASPRPSLTTRSDGQPPNEKYSVQLNITQNDIHHHDKPNLILDCPLNSLCYRPNVVIGYEGIALVKGSATGQVNTDFVECRMFMTLSGWQEPEDNPYGTIAFGYEPMFGDTNEYPFQGAVCYMAGGFRPKPPNQPPT